MIHSYALMVVVEKLLLLELGHKVEFFPLAINRRFLSWGGRKGEKGREGKGGKGREEGGGRKRREEGRGRKGGGGKR